MFTKIMKIAAIVSLLGALVWRSPAGYELFVEIVIGVSAILVMFQAVATRSFAVVGLFGVVALVFNPIVPVTLSPTLTLWLRLACMALFALSIFVLKPERQKLSMPSITDRTPGSESL